MDLTCSILLLYQFGQNTILAVVIRVTANRFMYSKPYSLVWRVLQHRLSNEVLDAELGQKDDVKAVD